MSPNPVRGLAVTSTGVTDSHIVSDVELIKPFPETVYVKLLFSKPVSDWEKMTTFLVNRKLISFAVLENWSLSANGEDTLPKMSPAIAKMVSEKKERVKAAHEARLKDQAAAKTAKKARVAAAHQKRVLEQQAAAKKRAENRSRQETARVEAAKKRRTRAVAATKVTDLKKAADVKVWLEASLDAQIVNSKDSHSTRLALQTLPPVIFSKQDVRPVRPLVKLQKANGVESEVEVSDIQNFDLLQEIIRSADRHLSYLFHEADTEGWKLVTRKRAIARAGNHGRGGNVAA